jgi:hypothetical protein
MRVLGLEPKTYGLKGHNTAHNYLSPLFLYAFFYVNNALHNYSRLSAECQQKQSRDNNDVQVTYEIADIESHTNRETSSTQPQEKYRRKLRFQRDVWLCKPLVTVSEVLALTKLTIEITPIRQCYTSVLERKTGFW